MDEQGAIYLLRGDTHAARLVVSVASLRQQFRGPVTILASGNGALGIAQHLRDDPRLDVEVVAVPECGRDKKSIFVFKTSLHRYAPYDVNVYLDCDTLVTGDVSPLFELPSPRHVLVTQFCDWNTSRKIIAHRIRNWADTHPHLVRTALEFGPAINAGVFSFTCQTELLRGWEAVAQAGREHFIADELAMQLLLPHHKHVILDGRFNCSPKYGAPENFQTRIVHFHGSKHLDGYTKLWRDAFEAVYAANLGNLQEWAPAGDRKLQAYMRATRPGG